MGNEDGSVQVIFVGEIYNHKELRGASWPLAGHRFAYRPFGYGSAGAWMGVTWGEELPKKLRGMFTFVIWDTRSDALFMARDRMGQKPLFYAGLEDGVVFGSTIPSVLAWPEVPRRVPRQHIALYLQLGFLPPPWTIYRDVVQLRPGHFLTSAWRDDARGGVLEKCQAARMRGRERSWRDFP